MEYTKISATQLEATKEIPARIENLVYERGMVEDRVALILKEIALKEAELKECQDVLKTMDEKGIVLKEVVDNEPLPIEKEPLQEKQFIGQ
jgi:hypothetical protein